MFLRDGRIALFLSIMLSVSGTTICWARGDFAAFYAWLMVTVGLVFITVIDRFDP